MFQNEDRSVINLLKFFKFIAFVYYIFLGGTVNKSPERKDRQVQWAFAL